MGLHKRVKVSLKKHTRKLAGFDLAKITQPESLLIIPDGNARWARIHGKDVSEGHTFGAVTMNRLLEEFLGLKTKVIGIWGFSEDNWKRPAQETHHIFSVINNMILGNLPKFKKNNFKFLCLGNRERIKAEYPYVYKAIEKAERETRLNTKKFVALFLDYGERFVLEEFSKERAKDSKTPTYALLSKVNKGLPLFEMVVRTSGERRLSGFGPLASLAEFISVKKNLPEMTARDLINVLKEFSSRQRRFGGRPEITASSLANAISRERSIFSLSV